VRGQTLVIGFGNTLRGDDGIGNAVAEAVAGMAIPDVRALAVHQLTPELAADIADVDVVVFVDAAMNAEPVTALCLDNKSDSPALTHITDPRSLLQLSRTVFGRSPQGWLVTAAANEFGFHEGLSESGRRNALLASDLVAQIIRNGCKAVGDGTSEKSPSPQVH
jgi:hydrogenase maturation protease